jgi:cyclophilin family peptidyl-prolyl cis-trans isomerase
MLIGKHLWKRLGLKNHASRQRSCLQRRRCAIESLESRQLLSITLPTIGSQTVLTGAPLNVVLNGSETSGHALTYSATVTSLTMSGGSLTAGMSSSSNPSLKLSISDPDDSLSGDVVFQLFKDLAPNTVDHIMSLVNAGKYDNTTFGRIIKNFMIQGGFGSSGSQIDDEFTSALQFTGSGLLAMANANSSTKSDTGASQFFITTEPTRWLDFRHTIFGIVTQNYDLISKLDDVPTTSDAPNHAVTITDAQIITDMQNGVLRLSAPTGAAGLAYVTVTATDTVTNAKKSTSFLVTVSADTNNDQPFLKAIDPIKTSANTPVAFTIPATDVEGDSIAYYAAVDPADANLSVSMNSYTGVVTVTPLNGAYGVSSIKVGVTRLSGLIGTDKPDYQYVPVYVAPAKPTLVTLATVSDTGSDTGDGVTNLNNSAGKALQFQVSGVLENALVQLYAGSTLIGSATVPSGATSVTVTTNGSVTLADGLHAITATQTLENQIVDVNNLDTTTSLVSPPSTAMLITVDTTRPQFYFPVPTTAVVGVPYQAHLAVAEGSLTGVTYQLISAPTGMSLDVVLNLVTLINWTPTASQVGEAQVTVQATDSAGNTKQLTYSINVLESNNAPVLSAASPDLGTTNLPAAKTIALADFVNNVSDADADAVLGGIALSGIGGAGIWQYSLDGTNFAIIESVVEQNALLLPYNAVLRFTPLSSCDDVATLTYHAWDATGGAAGGRVDLSAAGATGGSTAYSTAVNMASLSIKAACSIAGFVYIDADNDGLRISPTRRVHNGIQGVTISLCVYDYSAGAWSSPIATTTTNANGYYRFGDLAPGVYLVQETQPTGYLDGKDTLGTVAGQTKGQIGADMFAIRLDDASPATDYNFGERRLDGNCFLAADPLDTTQKALYVYGTAGNDTIVINPGKSAGDVKVVANGVNRGTFHPSSRVIVLGLAGNDTLRVSNSVSVPAWLYGDAGNDSLSGGGGPTVLFGGAGNDSLVSGNGRSLLIGGAGNDSLAGGAGGAVLIGGTTDYDANDRALSAILGEWKLNTPAKTRMAHLTGTKGGMNNINAVPLFLDRVSVHDDAAKDALVGGTGADLIYQGSADSLKNRLSADVVVKAAASFALAGPTSGLYAVGEDITIDWAANFVGAGSKVSLCYDPDAAFGNANQTWIVIDRPLTAAGDGSYVWDTTGMKAGTYYIGGYVWSNGKAIFSHLTKPITLANLPAPTGYSVEANDSLIGPGETASAGFTLHDAQVGAIYSCTISSSSGGSPIVVTGKVTSPNQSVPVDVSSLPDGTLTFAVTLKKGLTGPVATATATLDRVAPTGYSITPDAAATSSSTVGFRFVGAEVGATYSYTITDGSNTIGPVTGTITSAAQTVTGIDVSGLADGNLVISATLTDPVGNVGSAVTAGFTLDRVAPSGYSIVPAVAIMNTSTVGFTLSDAEVGTSYECTIVDSASHTVGPFTGTVTAATQTITGMDVSSLVDGEVTFYVSLTDAAGNEGVLISASGQLDRTPPTGYNVVASTTLTKDMTIGFTLTGAEADATYTYTITDSQGHTVGPVPGPVNSTTSQDVGGIDISSLSDGTLTLSVTLTDVAGNTGTAVVDDNITLDRTPPTGYSVTTPSPSMNGTNVGFIIDGAEVGASYRYTISDGVITLGPATGTITSATQTITGIDVSSLADGNLVISATLTDAVGNVGSTVTAAFTLDRVAPSSYTIAPTVARMNASTVGFTFLGAEVGTMYECTVMDNEGHTVGPFTGTVTAATQTITGMDVSSLVDGEVTFYVSLTDAAGNEGILVSTSGQLDRTPPTGYNVVASTTLTKDMTIGFTLTGAEADASYTYTITDSQGHTVGPVTGPVNSTTSQDVGGIDISSLSDGKLTLSVTLTDAAGNTGTAVVDDNITLDRTPPTGYSATASHTSMNGTNIGFIIDGAEVGATYRYTISDGVITLAPVTGTITSATQTISGMDVSVLSEGNITFSVTLIDAAGNTGSAVTTTATLDRTAPSGYSITVPSTDILASEATDTSFTFVDAELDAHYKCIVSSSGGFYSVTYEGTVTSADQTISGIDVSSLAPGVLTYYVTLTDAAGNVGSEVTATRNFGGLVMLESPDWNNTVIVCQML